MSPRVPVERLDTDVEHVTREVVLNNLSSSRNATASTPTAKPSTRKAPLSIVVGSVASGMTFAEIEQEYDITRDDITRDDITRDDITRDDIRAALRYAGELVDREQHYLLPQ